MKIPLWKRPRTIAVLALILLDLVAAVAGLGVLALILTVALAGYGFFSGCRAVLNRSRLIWGLRNRLIVTYIFIGAIPIVLILALAYCGAWIVVGQVATFLVDSELHRHARMLENPARFLSQSSPAYRDALMAQMAPLLRDGAPGFQAVVTGDREFHYPPESRLQPPPAGWNKYTGIVFKDGAIYSMALARDGPRTAAVIAPLDSEVLEKLVPGIGSIGFLTDRPARFLNGDPVVRRKSGVQVKLDNRDFQFTGPHAGRVPAAYNSFDFEYPWANPIDVAYWNEPNSRSAAVLSVNTRPSAVLGVVFGDRVDLAQTSLQIFIVIAGLLAIVESVSIVIGVSMTRTITSAVHNIYEGTLRIGKGDFSHRIPVKGRDQLAALGKSFNEMSEQLGKLVAVTKEKERLQSELAIASEVQNQLFPRSAPIMRTILLTGSCEPARSVSGDYYDYLRLPNGNLALAIGDVAGKGISAALLMASIQSIIRTQLAQGLSMAGAANGSTGPPYSTASMVEQLNRQLYASTSPEKYATFFFGIYDDNSRILRYTNAGHLPPLLVCGGNVNPLDVTGTVVGLFPALTYQEQTVSLCSGDMLIAYTDGITEPENAYGEEFGAERLSETVLRNQQSEPREIVSKVMEAVKLFSGAPELPDDMTVMIARGVA